MMGDSSTKKNPIEDEGCSQALDTVPDFPTKVFCFDSNNVEDTPLEDLLLLLIDIIKEDNAEAMKNLEACEEEDKNSELAELIVQLLNAIEVCQLHFEFAVAVFLSQSEGDIERLKEGKFKRISYLYEKVKTKDDLTRIPMNYVLAIFHDKLLVQTRILFGRCFIKDAFGNVKLCQRWENVRKMKVLLHKYQIADKHCSLVITFPKDDIFSLSKHSTEWKDLYECATFKQFLSKSQVHHSFKLMRLTLYLGNIICNTLRVNKDYSAAKMAYTLAKKFIYYSTCEERAEIECLYNLIDPKIEEAFEVWNCAEHPFVAQCLQLLVPRVKYDKVIWMNRLFPAITKEVIKQEYADESFNRLCPIDKFYSPDLKSVRDEVISEITTSREDKIPVRILAPDYLTFLDKPTEPGLIGGVFNKTKAFFIGEGNKKPTYLDTAIIIHIHGGGFVSMSSGTDRIFLNRWVNNLNMVHFAIDYRLAPKNQFPDGLDDVWQAYLWIIDYKRVILTGDSAGGNLSMALMLRLIRAGLPTPDGCLLAYPNLYVDAESYSPSYITSIDDPILPTSLLKLVAKAYVPEGFKYQEDPFISPMLASDELLEKLPPIRIIAGTADPLYDDNWRLLSKLRRLNKDAKIIVHEHIPHAYLCHPDLKNYDLYIEEACDLIRELIELSPQP